LVTRIVQASRDLPTAMLVAMRPEPVRPRLARLGRRPDVEVLGLPPLDAMDLDVLVREHTGHWPGPRLRNLLAGSAANPLQAVTTLEDLRRSGAVQADLRSRGLGEALIELAVTAPSHGPGAAVGASTVAELVAHRVAQLDGRPRELARALAVCGANTPLETLAAVLTVEPVILVEPAQALVDAGLVAFHGDRLGFSHDAYREAVYDAVPAPLRSVLHAAVADRVTVLDRARHLIAGQAPTSVVLDAVAQAGEELRNASAVEAELLEQAAGLTEGDTQAACAQAAWRESGQSRDLAHQALAIAEECGARGIAARIRGRMRAAGVRLGSTAPRQKPTAGWASLTPTESQIADLVAAGLTGPGIGGRLHVSPRTVQTHVSHVLAKLNLANRIELAAAVAAHNAAQVRSSR
jgi:DNA-binding NarL/FixJ family response regulator